MVTKAESEEIAVGVRVQSRRGNYAKLSFCHGFAIKTSQNIAKLTEISSKS